jgi:hypothetical protein
MITVKDLIEYLQKLPQDALLVYPEIECNDGWLDREYWVAEKIDHVEREGSDYELDPTPYSSKRINRKGIYIMLDM